MENEKSQYENGSVKTISVFLFSIYFIFAIMIPARWEASLRCWEEGN